APLPIFARLLPFTAEAKEQRLQLRLCRNFGIALAASVSPTIFNRDSTILNPAELAQSLHKGGNPIAPGRSRSRAQQPYGSVAFPPAARAPRAAMRPQRRQA